MHGRWTEEAHVASPAPSLATNNHIARNHKNIVGDGTHKHFVGRVASTNNERKIARVDTGGGIYD